MTDAPVPEVPVVLVDDDGPIRTLTLNRPAQRNAVDLELRVVLAEAVEAAGSDPAVRAIVITGAAGTFCSGGDISTMAPTPGQSPRDRAEAMQRIVRAIWATPTPVLAAVEGFAYGAGAAIALACDRVVAASDARFSTAFTGIGLAGDTGIFVSLPARVGPARAKQMLLLPEPVGAEDGLTVGLVDRVVAPGEALPAALADAARLAVGPARALGVVKQMLTGGPKDPLEVLDLEVAHHVDLWETADFAEGVAAFRAKRPPHFS